LTARGNSDESRHASRLPLASWRSSVLSRCSRNPVRAGSLAGQVQASRARSSTCESLRGAAPPALRQVPQPLRGRCLARTHSIARIGAMIPSALSTHHLEQSHDQALETIIRSDVQ
jgi:hypothetical protein